MIGPRLRPQTTNMRRRVVTLLRKTRKVSQVRIHVSRGRMRDGNHNVVALYGRAGGYTLRPVASAAENDSAWAMAGAHIRCAPELVRVRGRVDQPVLHRPDRKLGSRFET